MVMAAQARHVALTCSRARSPDGALSAFTRVFDALWRNAGVDSPHPDFAPLHPGYKVQAPAGLERSDQSSQIFCSLLCRCSTEPSGLIRKLSQMKAKLVRVKNPGCTAMFMLAASGMVSSERSSGGSTRS